MKAAAGSLVGSNASLAAKPNHKLNLPKMLVSATTVQAKMVKSANEANVAASAEVVVAAEAVAAANAMIAASAVIQNAMTRANATTAPKHVHHVKTVAIAVVVSATSVLVSAENVAKTPTTANLSRLAT